MTNRNENQRHPGIKEKAVTVHGRRFRRVSINLQLADIAPTDKAVDALLAQIRETPGCKKILNLKRPGTTNERSKS